MSTRRLSAALASIAIAAAAMPALAADVTPQRLLNTADEPQNWLMVHHDYNNSRHSPLKEVNRDTVKDLKLKFIFSIGGRSTGGTLRGKEESTPLVDDGFMYVSDTWDRVMKFDVRSGTEAVPLWRYDPKITQVAHQPRDRDVRQQGLHLHQRHAHDRAQPGLRRAGLGGAGDAPRPIRLPARPSAKTQGVHRRRRWRSRPPAARSWSCRAKAPAASSAPEAGSAPGTSIPASWRGAPSPSRPRASPARRPGRTTTTPGGSAAAASGRPRPTTRRPTCSITAPATRSRASIPSSGPATICSPPAPSRSTPIPARSSGISRRRRTSIGTSIRRAPRCSTRSRSTARPARWWRTSRATASSTRSTAPAASSCAPISTRRRSPGPRASIPRPASPSTMIPPRNVQLYAGVGGMRGKPGQEACPWYNGSPTFFPPTLDQKRMIAYVAGAEGCWAGTTVQDPDGRDQGLCRPAALLQEQGRITAHGAMWALDVRTGKVVAKAEFPASRRVRHAEHRRRSAVHRAPRRSSGRLRRRLRSRSCGASASAPRSRRRR